MGDPAGSRRQAYSLKEKRTALARFFSGEPAAEWREGGVVRLGSCSPPRAVSAVDATRPEITISDGRHAPITAYDSSIYGNLTGVVERVSADSLTDETDKRIQYYRVYVRTNRAYMQTKDGKRWPILPGMVAATEIKTGHRTVMQYLLKPLNKAKEAMRER